MSAPGPDWIIELEGNPSYEQVADFVQNWRTNYTDPIFIITEGMLLTNTRTGQTWGTRKSRERPGRRLPTRRPPDLAALFFIGAFLTVIGLAIFTLVAIVALFIS